MLQSLDTVIAFVVILLTISLLVTILVQMLSAAFSLRGKNLGNALALTFQSIHPDLTADAYKLAERILGDPLLSDSTTTTKQLGKHATPDQAEPWSWWSPFKGLHLANAIRPEEVYATLQKLAGESAPTKTALETARTAAQSAQADYDRVVANPESTAEQKTKAKADLDQATTTMQNAQSAENAALTGTLRGAAASILAKLETDPAKADAIKAKFSTVLGLADNLVNPADKQRMLDAIQQTSANLVGQIDTARDKFEKWFSSAQDRAQQWFQLHTRIFTIICGTLLAFLLQLDTVEIFRFVSTNSAARAALVGDADKLVDRADGILEKNGNMLDYVYAAVRKTPSGKALPEKRSASVADATNTVALRAALTEVLKPTDADAFKKDYDAAEQEAVNTYYKDRRGQMADLTKGVAATGFDIIPEKLFNRWKGETGTCVPHFWGMVITAALLSLGAPYWYNVLKNLTSLRPALAQLVGGAATAPAPAKK